MSAVHIRPAEVVDRTTAGKVVERPASAEKELVENPLEASATAINVEVARRQAGP